MAHNKKSSAEEIFEVTWVSIDVAALLQQQSAE
jgi:hypothetical protein